MNIAMLDTLIDSFKTKQQQRVADDMWLKNILDTQATITKRLVETCQINSIIDTVEKLRNELKACCDAVSFYPNKDECLSEFLKAWVTTNAERTEIKALKEEVRLLRLELGK
jgi:hypothetical protein